MNEQRFKKEFRIKLLNHLLDKYECSTAFTRGEATKQRPQMLMKEELFRVDYEDEMDFRKREWIHEVVDELAGAGIITFKQERSSGVIEKVYMEWEKVPDAYDLVGRQTKNKKMTHLASILEGLYDHPWDWVSQWSHQVVAALTEKRTVRLDINDPKSYQDAVRVLQELPSLSGDIPKRMFSLRVFGNSKYFEQYVERRVLSIVRQGLGNVSELGEGELDLIGIVSQPKPVLLGGYGQFALNATTLSLELFPDGMAIYPETLKTFVWRRLAVERIIVIENLSSYHQWLRVRRSLPELVIYCGGFPHRILQSFLHELWRAVKEFNETVDIYHWGDIDLGGIQIYEFLQRDCPLVVHPLFMDEKTLRKFGEVDWERPEQYRKKAARLSRDQTYSKWKSLLVAIAETGLRVEQESVSDELVQRAFDF